MPQKPLANAGRIGADRTWQRRDNGPRNSGGFGRDNTINIDGDTLIQPRLGFNYTLDSKRPTQVRGGVGLFQGAAASVDFQPFTRTRGCKPDSFGCGGISRPVL